MRISDWSSDCVLPISQPRTRAATSPLPLTFSSRPSIAPCRHADPTLQAGPLRASPSGVAGGDAVEVVLVGILHQHLDDVALLRVASVAELDFAVNLGGVGLGAPRRAAFTIGDVDDDVDGAADLGLELGGGDE